MKKLPENPHVHKTVALKHLGWMAVFPRGMMIQSQVLDKAKGPDLLNRL